MANNVATTGGAVEATHAAADVASPQEGIGAANRVQPVTYLASQPQIDKQRKACIPKSVFWYRTLLAIWCCLAVASTATGAWASRSPLTQPIMYGLAPLFGVSIFGVLEIVSWRIRQLLSEEERGRSSLPNDFETYYPDLRFLGLGAVVGTSFVAFHIAGSIVVSVMQPAGSVSPIAAHNLILLAGAFGLVIAVCIVVLRICQRD